MTNLKEQFYQTKNIEFLKKTLGRELWVQVSGSKDINGASAAFWAALMPVENIDEAYRDYSWNSVGILGGSREEFADSGASTLETV